MSKQIAFKSVFVYLAALDLGVYVTGSVVDVGSDRCEVDLAEVVRDDSGEALSDALVTSHAEELSEKVLRALATY